MWGSFGDDEDVLKSDSVMIARLCEYVKTTECTLFNKFYGIWMIPQLSCYFLKLQQKEYGIMIASISWVLSRLKGVNICKALKEKI